MITLAYNGRSLQLRNPDFGNTETIEKRRIVRNTRGGDLKIFSDPNWPSTRVLKFAFSFLKESEISEIFSFLAFSLGRVVAYTDYEGRIWNGVIITPMAEAVESARHNRTISLSLHVEV